jgi:hypothetical protein
LLEICSAPAARQVADAYREYLRSIDAFARVIPDIAETNVSRFTEAVDAVGRSGVCDRAYTVIVYALRPGPFEHGGA